MNKWRSGSWFQGYWFGEQIGEDPLMDIEGDKLCFSSYDITGILLAVSEGGVSLGEKAAVLFSSEK